MKNPAEDCQRRWNVGLILRNNARHQDDPKPLPERIAKSPDNYATLMRPLPESKTDRMYVYDMDYRCDPWDDPVIYNTNSRSFKIHVQNPKTS